jgi:hypothetical protein
MEARIAISFSRVVARESMRLVTFVHAIRRTSATAVNSKSSRTRTSDTMPTCNETTLTSAFQLAGIGQGNNSLT